MTSRSPRPGSSWSRPSGSRARVLPPTWANCCPNRQPEHLPFLTEPVVGTIVLRTKASGMELLALGPDGKIASRSTPAVAGDALTIQLPAGRGTHWYILKNKPPAAQPAGGPPPAVTTSSQRRHTKDASALLRPSHDAGSHRGTDSTSAPVDEAR